MRDVVFAFVWMVLLPISFYSAHIGILLWIWVALLAPSEFLYGFLGGIPFNKVVAVITLLTMVASPEKKKFYLDSVLCLLLVFLVHCTLSHFDALVPSDAADDLYQRFLKVLALAFIFTGVMWSRHRLHQAVLVFCASFGFVGVKEGLYYVLTAGGHKIYGLSSVGDNNGLAVAMLMTVPLLLYVARYSAEKLVRIGCYVSAGLCLVTIIGTGSRGGFVGMVMLGLMLIQRSRYKVRAILGVAAVAALVYALAPESWFERLSTIREAGAGEDQSFATRVVAWKISFLLAMDHPFFGGGFSSILRIPTWVHYSAYLPTLDWIIPSTPVNRTFVAHSIYFQAMGDFGFVGLGIFLVMMGNAMLVARRIKRMTRNEPALAWANDLARSLEICIVVYMVAGAALSILMFEPLYLLLAVLSRTQRTVREGLAASAAPAPVPVRGRLVAAVPAGR